MQNIPSHNKEIRKMFRASEGFVLISCDFSQQEPRTLAHMSKDEHLIQAYRDGKDIYAWIAEKIYNVPYDECREFRADGTKNPEGKKRRDSVKSIILGRCLHYAPSSGNACCKPCEPYYSRVCV